jgi:uncharacterized membrane protein required for colicin V production
MNYIDALVLGLMAFFLVVDGIQGFIKNAIIYSGIIIGLWVVIRYFHEEWFLPFVGYLGIIFGIILVIFLLSQLLKPLEKVIAKVKKIKIIDHFLGSLFGIAKGFIVASIIIMALELMHLLPEQWKENSYSYPQVAKINNWIKKEVPQIFEPQKAEVEILEEIAK